VVERVMAVTLKPFIITPRIEEILQAVYFYRFMTALDITTLLFSSGSLTHCRDILKLLCGGHDYIENQYLFRFPLPQFSTGRTEKIFTLGAKGREFLRNDVGLDVNWYYRPKDTIHLSYRLVNHNLTLTRFLICCHVWTRKAGFAIKDLQISYQLEGSVIPDAWILFFDPQKNIRAPVLLEVDRGSEYKHQFKQHVWSRIEFLRSGSYEKKFNGKGCTIAYITTGESPEYRESRARAMRGWTMEILEEMDMENWASILKFATVVRKEMYNAPLLDGTVWRRPDSDTSVALLHD
jgi:Replication-relaxation